MVSRAGLGSQQALGWSRSPKDGFAHVSQFPAGHHHLCPFLSFLLSQPSESSRLDASELVTFAPVLACIPFPTARWEQSLRITDE